MGRGLFSGLIWGTVVSAVGLGTVSLMTEQPPGRVQPDAPATDVAEQPAVQPAETESPDPAAETKSPEQPQLIAPSIDGAADAVEDPSIDTTLPVVPQTGPTDTGSSAPQVDETSDVQIATDDPVLSSPAADEPIAPEGEDDLSISSEPAQPIAPEIDETPNAAPQTEEIVIVDEPAEPEAETAAPEESAQGDPDVVVIDPTPEIEEPAFVEPEDLTPDSEGIEAAAPKTIGEDSAATGFGETVGSLTDRAAGVKVNRFLGDSASNDSKKNPFIDNAEPFNNPDDKPVVALVLIDDGSLPLSGGVLQSLPFTVTFAVDAAATGARALADKYRAAGFEVLMTTNLPAGVDPSDIEVVMQAYLDNIPQAVGVLDTGENGLQDSRETVTQVVEILAASGHGLVTQKQGLGTVVRAAEKAQVPSVTIFRDLDLAGQDSKVITRFLDQAAFRAGQTDDAIVILGRTRPDTIAALLTWGSGQRASRLAFAPVSAAME